MNGWHILITGGSSGIGLALAQVLHDEGATLHISGRSKAHLDEAAAQLGSNVRLYESDTACADQREKLISDVLENSGGRLDGLVVNAAIYGYVPLLEVDNAQFENYFHTNTAPAFHFVKGFHKALCEGEGKSVLFISSTLATRPVPGTGAYAATKAAMNSLAKSWSLELAADKIRVNCILPGVVNTPIHDPVNDGDMSRDEKMAMLAEQHPIGRVGQPMDIANAAHFLLSSNAGWVTGSEFYVDGGISLV